MKKFQNDLEKSRLETIKLFYQEIDKLFITAQGKIELRNKAKLQTNVGLRSARINKLKNLEIEYCNLIKKMA